MTVINLKDILSELFNVKQNKEKKHINFWKSIFGVYRIAIVVDRKKRVPSFWRLQIIEGSRWFSNLILKWLFNSKRLKGFRGFKQQSGYFNQIKLEYSEWMLWLWLHLYSMDLSFLLVHIGMLFQEKSVTLGPYLSVGLMYHDTNWLNESIKSVFTAFYEFVTHWQRYHKEKHTKNCH